MPTQSSPVAVSRSQEQSFLARQFEHRSGRIIALCRFVLATVFFVALWVDPSLPVRSTAVGYTLLFAYMLAATVWLLLAWRNWWWDQRLAWPVHVADVAIFLAAVYFTETVNDDFTSPFLAFFSYLMLSATIRWDWRVTMVTAVAVTALYLLVGIAMDQLGLTIDMFRFGRRVAYMLVLALVLVWFGLQRREQSVERFVEPPGGSDDGLPPLLEALRYTMAQTDAERGAIAWADDEEPHIEIRSVGLERGNGRLAPEDLNPDDPFADKVQLFDADRGRVLRMGKGYAVSFQEKVDDPLSRHCGVRTALALPFSSVTGRGEILLVGIPGVCADHIELGTLLAREVGAAFDRQSTLALVRETAVARMRDAVARDLHDSIAQSLAGAALRLEGLRSWIRAGGDPDDEIQTIKTALRAEQNQVRGMIERLRRGDTILPDGTASATLTPMLQDLSEYWSISAELQPGSKGIVIPGWLAHELRQVLREAVANAVRHGEASRVAIALAEENGMLRLTVADNGTGFPVDGPSAKPRSISERVAALGGSLDIESSRAGTELRFALPLENR